MEYFSKLNFYFLIIFFLALLFPFLFLKFIHPVLKKVIEKKNKNLFKNLVKLRFFYTLGYILSPLILLLTLNNTSMIGSDLQKFTYIIKKVSGIWIIVSLSILLNKLLTALNDTFKKNEFFIKYPVNSYLQLIKPGLTSYSSILFRDESLKIDFIENQKNYDNVLKIKTDLDKHYARKKSTFLICNYKFNIRFYKNIDTFRSF